MMQLSATLLHIVNLLSDNLNQVLCDRFNCGICDKAIRRRLLSEKALTFEKAMELALLLEAADKNAKSVNNYDGIKKLNFKGKQLASPQRPCSRCEKSNHSPKKCKFKDAIYHFCGKKGHIAPACRAKLQKKTQGQIVLHKADVQILC